jgi:hypothetical protein
VLAGTKLRRRLREDRIARGVGEGGGRLGECGVALAPGDDQSAGVIGDQAGK